MTSTDSPLVSLRELSESLGGAISLPALSQRVKRGTLFGLQILLVDGKRFVLRSELAALRVLVAGGRTMLVDPSEVPGLDLRRIPGTASNEAASREESGEESL